MTLDDIADQLVAALFAEVPEYPAITDLHGGPPYRVCTRVGDTFYRASSQISRWQARVSLRAALKQRPKGGE